MEAATAVGHQISLEAAAAASAAAPAELRISLAATADGKKLVGDLKNDCPLAILFPTDISGIYKKIRVLI